MQKTKAIICETCKKHIFSICCGSLTWEKRIAKIVDCSCDVSESQHCAGFLWLVTWGDLRSPLLNTQLNFLTMWHFKAWRPCNWDVFFGSFWQKFVVKPECVILRFLKFLSHQCQEASLLKLLLRMGGPLARITTDRCSTSNKSAVYFFPLWNVSISFPSGSISTSSRLKRTPNH